jgi:hypothetical protein
LRSGGPLIGGALVFPTRDGELWRDHDWANWRRRVFDPLAATVGVSGMRPYDLRHAFCSLLIGEGMSVVEVARQAGHAPTMTLATYAHVIADLDGGERLSAEASIRAAREAEVSGKCPPPPAPSPAENGNPSVLGMGDPGLEPGTSSLSAGLRAATVVGCGLFAACSGVTRRCGASRSAPWCVSGVSRRGSCGCAGFA